MAIQWDHEFGIAGVNCESWTNENAGLLILSHPDPDTPDGIGFCNYARCPRTYRDLPHFVLYENHGEKQEQRRYAFEFLTIHACADTLLAMRKTPDGVDK